MLVPPNPPCRDSNLPIPTQELGSAFRLRLPTDGQNSVPRRLRHLLQPQSDEQPNVFEHEPTLCGLHYVHIDPNTPTLSLSSPTGGPANPPPPVSKVITDNRDLKTPRMNQWSFGMEQALWRNAGLELQYLGSHSYHLDRSYYNNTPYLPGPGAIQPRRPNQLFGAIRTIQNDEIGELPGLECRGPATFLQRRLSSSPATPGRISGCFHGLERRRRADDPYNWRADYGNSNWDIRHRFVAAIVWEIPFFKNANSWVRNAFGNWQVNGITTMQSGMPFNVTDSTDTANTSSGGSYRPNLAHAASADCGRSHLTGCIDPSAFAEIPTTIFAYGNAGRNLLHGPHLFTTDLSLFKNFRIYERLRLEFRFEAFNFTNSPQFSNPVAIFGTASFGNITSTSIENRDIQLGAKLVW